MLPRTLLAGESGIGSPAFSSSRFGGGFPDSRLAGNRETGNPRFPIRPGPPGIGVLGAAAAGRGFPGLRQCCDLARILGHYQRPNRGPVRCNGLLSLRGGTCRAGLCHTPGAWYSLADSADALRDASKLQPPLPALRLQCQRSNSELSIAVPMPARP